MPEPGGGGRREYKLGVLVQLHALGRLHINFTINRKTRTIICEPHA